MIYNERLCLTKSLEDNTSMFARGKKKEINRRQGKENYIGYLENTSQPEPSKNFEQNEIRNSDKIV